MHAGYEKDLFTVYAYNSSGFESSPVKNHVYKFLNHCQKHVNIQFQNAHDG